MNQIELRLERDHAKMFDQNLIKKLKEIPIEERSNGLKKANFIDPVSIIIVASAAVLIESLVDHLLKNNEKGLQIDLRKDPPMYSSISGIPRGVVVIIDKFGNAKTEKFDYENHMAIGEILKNYLGK